jgi:hypothetical protein
MHRFAAIAVLLLALAGCASLGVSGGSPLRAIDFAGDDVASLLLAFDMPEVLEPMAEGPAVRFDVAAGGETRHLRAVLVPADADELAGTLPPPRDGRLYYLFGFTDADKAAIRSAQSWAKSWPAGQGDGLSIALEPRFCASEPVDAKKVRFSVLVALPGSAALKPLAQDQPLGPVLDAIGATLPVCEGHSG